MDSDKINRWLTLLANFGVVLGLALLVYELRQSQNLAETEAAIGRLNEMQEAQSELALSDSLAEIQIKARTEGAQALSAVELHRISIWESSVRLRMQSHYVRYLRGFLDQETAENVVADAASNLAYWEDLGYELGNSEFEQAIRQAAGR